jgi:hypothetical protein
LDPQERLSSHKFPLTRATRQAPSNTRSDFSSSGARQTTFSSAAPPRGNDKSHYPLNVLPNDITFPEYQQFLALNGEKRNFGGFSFRFS